MSHRNAKKEIRGRGGRRREIGKEVMVDNNVAAAADAAVVEMMVTMS